LDLVILRMLLITPRTAYEIDNSIMEKFDGKRSPSVIYTKLSSMERKNLIKCVLTKYGRVYNITEKGTKIINDIPRLIEEIQAFAPILLGR
jgi:DNA-binding PadR family transcriptional regulator